MIKSVKIWDIPKGENFAVYEIEVGWTDRKDTKCFMCMRCKKKKKFGVLSVTLIVVEYNSASRI